MRKKIMITGASSGFGKAMAHRFAKEGWSIVITGRRKKILLELAEELTAQYGAEVLVKVFDVQQRKEVFDVLANDEKLGDVDVVVNNAGLALGRDYFDEANLDDWETMIDTNLKGLLYVSKAMLPYLIKRGKGHIINIGSTAGKEVYEKGNVYCATKTSVDAISQAMRIDMLRHQIKVTAIHPGAAETEFSIVRFKGDASMAKTVYEGYQPLKAEDVADTAFYCANLPEHVCINSVVMTCTSQANSFYLLRK
ncbi:MAG: SDR family NAD(P)-dependent oxidoreductase [Bacteroidetes bacterium]|nr:SDR family NAD(P)-dependent oxidoreductase [Bacteroidota bacterium]